MSELSRQAWSVRRLGDIAAITLGGTPSTEVPSFWDGDVPWMSSGDIHQRRISEVPGRISRLGLAASNATMVSPPAVAVALAGQGKTRGTVALVTTPLCTNQSVALIVGKPGDLDTSFLFHALDLRYEELRARSSGGGRAGLSRRVLAEIPIQLPSIAEQRAIAQLLDTADRTIRSATSLTEKILDVKQGVLDDLLSRGLTENDAVRDPDENPSMFRDSPIGRIPWNWAVRRIGDIAHVTVGHVGPTTNYYTNKKDGVLFLRTGNITKFGLDLDDVRYVTRSFHRASPKSTLEAGDVVVSRVGDTGVASVIPDLGEANCANIVIVRKPVDLFPELLRLLFGTEMVQSQVRRFTAGSVQAVLNVRLVQRLWIPIPPVEQQESLLAVVSSLEERVQREKESFDKHSRLRRGLAAHVLAGATLE